MYAKFYNCFIQAAVHFVSFYKVNKLTQVILLIFKAWNQCAISYTGTAMLNAYLHIILYQVSQLL